MENIQLISQQLERALLMVDEDTAEKIIFEAVKKESPIQVAGELISDALSRIGDAWEEGTLSLAQVYISGVICERIIDKLLPPQSPMRKDQPTTAIAVFEDFHLLGKRIIYSTLRAGGIELIDLGGGMTIEGLIKKVEELDIKILLISVLMLHSALHLEELIRYLRTKNVKVVVGGAPFRFDRHLWKEIGADYYGKDSSDAMRVVLKLMEEQS